MYDWSVNACMQEWILHRRSAPAHHTHRVVIHCRIPLATACSCSWRTGSKACPARGRCVRLWVIVAWIIARAPLPWACQRCIVTSHNGVICGSRLRSWLESRTLCQESPRSKRACWCRIFPLQVDRFISRAGIRVSPLCNRAFDIGLRGHRRSWGAAPVANSVHHRVHITIDHSLPPAGFRWTKESVAVVANGNNSGTARCSIVEQRVCSNTFRIHCACCCRPGMHADCVALGIPPHRRGHWPRSRPPIPTR